MGQVILTISEEEGVTRVQLRATSATEEKRSLKLYSRLKPIIETIDVHIPRRPKAKPQ